MAVLINWRVSFCGPYTKRPIILGPLGALVFEKLPSLYRLRQQG